VGDLLSEVVDLKSEVEERIPQFNPCSQVGYKRNKPKKILKIVDRQRLRLLLEYTSNYSPKILAAPIGVVWLRACDEVSED